MQLPMFQMKCKIVTNYVFASSCYILMHLGRILSIIVFLIADKDEEPIRRLESELASFFVKTQDTYSQIRFPEM
jgi:hypothetical protein